MKHSKQMIDGALLLALFVMFIFAILFLPVLSPFVMFLLPVPFIIYAAEYDWIPSLFLMGFAVILATIIFVSFVSIPLVAFAGSGGLVIGAAIYRKTKPYETWANGTIGFIVGLLFSYLFTQYVFEINWVNEINAMIEESLQMSKEMLQQLNLGPVDETFELVEEQFAHITDLLPAGLVIVSIVFAFISQWISYKFLNRFKGKDYRFPPFRSFKLPTALIWIYFIALLLTILGLRPDEMVYIMANNVIVLVGFLLALQGFSFIFYYTHYKDWSIAIPIICVIITIFIPLILLYFVRIIGIIDIGFGMRRRLEQNRG